MRRYYLQSGLWMSVLTVLIFWGLYVAADLNATDSPSNALNIEGEFWSDTDLGFALDKISPRSTKIALGPNSNATVSIDLITDGGVGNQIDDGVHSGNVSGEGTKIAIEVFARGVTTTLIGVKIEFDFDTSVLKFDGAANPAFAFSIPEATGINLVNTAPVTLPGSGFIGRAEFSTVVDITGREFTLGIKAVTLAESSASSDVITTTDVIALNANPSPDFDGDGTVGFSDFLQFAGQFGARQGDGQYEARYDLDSDGAISFSDFLIFASSFGTQVPPSGGGGGGSTSIVDIPDANLRAVIADSLDKASGTPITRAEMATLTRIDAPNKGIRNLTGLEHATNLQILGLGRVRVNDELVNSNDISNLSPLSNLTTLTHLSLTSNSISDISVLSNLTNLTGLDLGGNSVLDISALSNLTNLTLLYLWENSISDISALSNLTNLTNLNLISNTISDISALSNLTNLTWLGLGGNSISDISALSNLTNLTGLHLWENSISDISALSNLTNLDRLYLRDNSISDISVLSNLRNLNRLYLRDNSISDISVLSNLRNLTDLSLSGNSVSDISVLSNLTNLTYLNLFSNSISDISALSNLTNLEILNLNSNNISDISALSNLANLTGLGLGGNSISDISALSNLTNLTILVLRGNSISDISPLVANKGLGSGDEVDLRSNSLSSTSINTHIPALQRRGVTVEFDSSSGSGGSGGGGSGVSLGPCHAGMVVSPNQSCTVSGGEFRNVGDGCFIYTPFGSTQFCVGNTFNLNGFTGTRVGNDFRIDFVP